MAKSLKMSDITVTPNEYKAAINAAKLPAHIAIIMDGNGRWARQQGLDRIMGHQHAVTSVREAAEAAAEIGIRHLTLYTFSTENWNRPQCEVDALMSLLVSTVHEEPATLQIGRASCRERV